MALRWKGFACFLSRHTPEKFIHTFLIPNKDIHCKEAQTALLFFGHDHGIWKFPGQGLNPCHSRDNTGSLTCWTTREVFCFVCFLFFGVFCFFFCFVLFFFFFFCVLLFPVFFFFFNLIRIRVSYDVLKTLSVPEMQPKQKWGGCWQGDRKDRSLESFQNKSAFPASFPFFCRFISFRSTDTS